MVRTREDMVRLYLDIETYRPREEDAWVNERIIAIGVLEDWTPYESSSLKKDIQPKLFCEWKLNSEGQLLNGFYKYIDGLFQKAKFIAVVGFNILRFDIPLLNQRAVEYGFKSLDKLNHLWSNTFTIDLLQQLLLANKNQFKGLSLVNVAKVLEKLGLPCPIKVEEHGKEVSEVYEKKEYDKIEKWLVQDIKICRWLELSGSIQTLIEHSYKENKAIFKQAFS